MTLASTSRNQPNPAAMRTFEDNAEARAAERESRRWKSTNLPWYIESIGNGATLEVISCVKRSTALCLTCGAAVQIGTPKYHYSRIAAHESWDVIMCETCHIALMHDVELVATCKQIKILENYENHAKLKDIPVNMGVQLMKLHELRKHQTAAGMTVQDATPNGYRTIAQSIEFESG